MEEKKQCEIKETPIKERKCRCPQANTCTDEAHKKEVNEKKLFN